MNLLNHRNLPPLPALRAFEAVARLGSVHQAALELAVTQSAVSHQLRTLEACLAIRLVQRQGRGLVLTEDGRNYVYPIRRALHDIALATQDFLNSGKDDELLLGMVPSFAAQWLAPRLGRLAQSLPKLKLSLRASLAVEDLSQLRVDAAIRLGAGPWPGLTALDLLHDRYVVVAAPGFQGGRVFEHAADIIATPKVLASEVWQVWQQACGLEPQALDGLRVNDSNVQLAMIASGEFCGMTRLSLVFDALLKGRLRALSSVLPAYPEPYWWVVPHRLQGSPKIQAFQAWLLAERDAYVRQVEAWLRAGPIAKL